MFKKLGHLPCLGDAFIIEGIEKINLEKIWKISNGFDNLVLCDTRHSGKGGGRTDMHQD